MQIVDNASHMGFCYFLKNKTEVGNKLSKKYIQQVEVLHHTPKFIRCDNAGDNTKYIYNIARAKRVSVEMTPPYSPHYNSVVERQYAAVKLKTQAMLT